MRPVILAYPNNDALARNLTSALGGEAVPVESRYFPDGEIYLRVAGSVEGKDAIIACGLDRPNEKTIGLFLLASTLRELGARRVLLVAPYLGYMRQDRSFHAGEGVNARYFARFLSSFLDGLVTVDPHLHRIHTLDEIYPIPTLVVAAAPEISAWVAKRVDMPFLVGPDSESEQWVSEVARGAGCPFVVLEKNRLGDREVEIAVPEIERWRGHTPVLIDDIISTARTMIAATVHLQKAGLRAPVCVGVHAIFAGNAHQDLVDAGVARIVTCNTVQHVTNGIDVHDILARRVAELI